MNDAMRRTPYNGGVKWGLSGAALAVALLIGGCGGDDTSVDGGVDASGDADVGVDTGSVGIASPAPPAPPVLTPCADGWREVIVDEIAVCEPWPESGRADCAEHEAHFPGRPGCERIGSECPAGGGFPSDLPAGRTIVYVRAGVTGGTGTEADPYGLIADALVDATPGGVVALAEGSYDEAIEIGDGVMLVGACAEGTHLVSTTAGAPDPVVRVSGADVHVEDVTIGPTGALGIKASGAGRSLTLRDVVVRDATSVAVLIEREATLDGERLVIRRTVPIASGLFGRGLDIENGATADVRWLASEQNHEWGVLALRADLVISDAVSRETRPNPTGGGPGFGANEGTLRLTRVVSEQNMDVGILSLGEGGSFEAFDTVVRDTTPSPALIHGGRGLNVQEGGQARCERCWIHRSEDLGVLASGGPVALIDMLLTDVSVRRTDMQIGRGVEIRDAAQVTLERVRVRRVSSEGILVYGAGTVFEGRDIDIADVRHVDGIFGRALMVYDGANATVERWEMSDLPEAGVLVRDEGTSVTMRDVRVRDVESRPFDGRLGRGINVQFGAYLTGERIVVERVRDIGIAALTPDSRIELSDVQIGPVFPVACASSSCADDPAGHGLGVYDSATFLLSRFEVTAPDFCGLHVADGAAAEMRNGTVRGATIGACVQSEAQDLSALSTSVQYIDNEQGLASTDLPVPGVFEEDPDT